LPVTCEPPTASPEAACTDWVTLTLLSPSWLTDTVPETAQPLSHALTTASGPKLSNGGELGRLAFGDFPMVLPSVDEPSEEMSPLADVTSVAAFWFWTLVVESEPDTVPVT